MCADLVVAVTRLFEIRAIIQPQQLSLPLPSDLFSTGSLVASVPARFQLSPPAVPAAFACSLSHLRGVHFD